MLASWLTGMEAVAVPFINEGSVSICIVRASGKREDRQLCFWILHLIADDVDGILVKERAKAGTKKVVADARRASRP